MNNYSVMHLVTLVEKIYSQGELDPFLDVAQIPNRIMLYLATHEKARPSEISDSIKVARPTIATHLKILEDNGFVTREINPSNRREIYVETTPKGQEMLAKNLEKLCSLFDEWLSILGDEKEHLFKILEISSDLQNIGNTFKQYVASKDSMNFEGEDND